jgi:hypothetical protein
VYNLIDSANRKFIDNMVNSIESNKRLLEDRTLDDASRIAIQNLIDHTIEDVNKVIDKYTLTRKDSQAHQSGQDFYFSMVDAFNHGISDVLKGKQTVKGFLLSAIDTFTSGIIDSFVNGITKGLTAKDGIAEKLFSGIGESVFSLGKGLVGGNTAKEKDWAASAMFEAAAAMNSLAIAISGSGFNIPGLGASNDKLKDLSWMDSIKSSKPEDTLGQKLDNALADSSKAIANAVGGLGDILRGGLSGIGGVLGARGVASGPSWLGAALKIGSAIFGGGGASMPEIDVSGLSQISAGAAESTIGSTDWLQGLQSGGVGMPVPILGHGGEVVLNAAQQNALLHGGNGSTDQTFNLNISGDISRQTRTEIQRMIPQIAAGVNQHNYENGKAR